MEKTVRDLMDYSKESTEAVGFGNQLAYALKDTTTGNMEQERIWTVVLILDPSEAKIMDGKVVIEKRVLARNGHEARVKAGVRAE